MARALNVGIGRPPPSIPCSEKVWPLTILSAFLARAREGHPSASGFDPAAPAPSYGDCSARGDRNRWPRGGCGVCALWHFTLGDRALIGGRCGRRTARGQCWSPVLADNEARRPAAAFAFLDFEIGGGGALRQPLPLAAAGRRAALGYGPRSECWHRPTDRFLKICSEKVWPLTILSAFLARARRATHRPAVSIRRRRRRAMGTAPREAISCA